MELDWTTFLMEGVNFLILVWILNRLLYAPVLRAITSRREAQEKARAEAAALRQEAAELEKGYRGRLAAWDEEKGRLRQQLQQELATERQRRMAELQASLEKEWHKAQVTEERRLADSARSAEGKALALAGRFASRLLERLASPELEARLVRMFIEDLEHLPEEIRRSLTSTLAEEGAVVQVTSAAPLDEVTRGAIRSAFGRFVPDHPQLEFHEDPNLVAGVRLTAGPWNLAANLRDELALFRETRHEG